jgi:mannose-6-phosphate isomerase-like protein (cupin superfamily)
MEPVDIFDHKGGFFRVLQRTSHSQTAVMTIEPGGEAGPEEEHRGDQIIYIVEGEARVRVQDQEYLAGPGTLLTIPARTRHYVTNRGAQPVFFLTIYAPPVY